VIIKERNLRQAIQEGLGQWKVDPQHAALFETAIMRRVDDYKEQPISFKEIKEVEELDGRVAFCWNVDSVDDARYLARSRTLLPQLAKRLKEAVYE
jgi:hypothetical protein